MKSLVALIIFFLNVPAVFSQTQIEMNLDAAKSLEKADKALNEVYQKILKEYKEDTVFIKNLKVSQRLWVQFRDAELNMKYPRREPGYYGSMHPLCWSSFEEELTTARTKFLKEWLERTDDKGCEGSVKIRDE